MSLESARREARRCEQSARRLGYTLQYEDGEARRYAHTNGWSLWIEPEVTGCHIRIYDPSRNTIADMIQGSVASMEDFLP